jgi:hypothetical protein
MKMTLKRLGTFGSENSNGSEKIVEKVNGTVT